MNKILQAQLDRIETALATLTESIATYNPSIPAAQALLSADYDLQQGLQDLYVHRRNHERIQQLRENIQRQNDQITSTLQLLADTRADLLSIPTSLPPPNRKHVSYTKLLDYAKHISQFTMPPTLRSQTFTEGKSSDVLNSADAGPRRSTENIEGIALESLVQEEKQWLDPWTGVQFTPWPSEELMKRSALAKIQGITEWENDLEGHGSETREGDVIGEGKYTDKSYHIEHTKFSVGGSGGGLTQRREEKPKVFGGLDLYDPDDEA